jgi:hypothetical protein
MADSQARAIHYVATFKWIPADIAELPLPLRNNGSQQAGCARHLHPQKFPLTVRSSDHVTNPLTKPS